jgi:hypothetical protein
MSKFSFIFAVNVLYFGHTNPGSWAGHALQQHRASTQDLTPEKRETVWLSYPNP